MEKTQHSRKLGSGTYPHRLASLNALMCTIHVACSAYLLFLSHSLPLYLCMPMSDLCVLLCQPDGQNLLTTEYLLRYIGDVICNKCPAYSLTTDYSATRLQHTCSTELVGIDHPYPCRVLAAALLVLYDLTERTLHSPHSRGDPPRPKSTSRR